MSGVQLKGVRKSFGALEVIKGVDLDIKPEEFVVFVGPSGCGKSTLLRIIAGLQVTKQTVERLIVQGILKPVDAEAASRLLNGAALNAALWIAASDRPKDVFPKVVEAFSCLATGLLAKSM
jgi:ABC-type taurine transport system ATPase subunit